MFLEYLLHQQQSNFDAQKSQKSQNLLPNLGKKLHDEYLTEKFSHSVNPQSVELPHALFNNKDLDSEGYQQLQRLVHAGLQQPNE